MQNFQYLQSLYSGVVGSLFGSGLTAVATVNIRSTDIATDGVTPLFGDPTNSTHLVKIREDRPVGLDRNYRLTVYPIETHTLSVSKDTQIVYSFAGKFTPYDLWISCKTSDAATGRDQHDTLFDYAESVEVSGVRYAVKAVIDDAFGSSEYTHVFLVKVSDV